MKFLIATNNAAFLSEATSLIKKELPHIKQIQDTLDQTELFKKISKKKFEYILIDLNSCSIDTQLFTKLTKSTETKVKIACQNHADIPNDFFNQKTIQLVSMNYLSIADQLKELILNNKDFLWGDDIKQFSLYKNEILCHEGSIGDAIYLIKEGFLQREFPDGSILDDSIGPGKLIGELAYFNRKPRKWKIVASENCTLIRIGYQKIDKQLENQPSWIKVMFTSLAERSLKYAKST